MFNLFWQLLWFVPDRLFAGSKAYWRFKEVATIIQTIVSIAAACVLLWWLHHLLHH